MKNFFLTAFAISVLVSVASYAVPVGQLGILDMSGINPATGQAWQAGDKYRLIFVTSSGTQATSKDIATYNAFVQNVANAAGLGSVTWKVVGSTASVNARDNTSTNPAVNGTGEAVLMMDGATVVANNYADLWNGVDPVDGGDSYKYSVRYDENGNVFIPYPTDGRVFTGSESNGIVSAAGQPLGGSSATPSKAQSGVGRKPASYTFPSAHWMKVFSDKITETRSVYGMSEILTVQDIEIYPSVCAGHSWITWSGQPVILDPVVINNDIQVPQRNLTSVWTAEPSKGVAITEDGTAPDDTSTPQAVVTVTTPTGTDNPSIFTLTLSVTLEGEIIPVRDSVTIDVYDNSCIAAYANGMVESQADFNRDCVVDVDDLAALAAAWLEDYSTVDF